MQQPASRAVKAARKRGVQAEGLRAYRFLDTPSADGCSCVTLYCVEEKKERKNPLCLLREYLPMADGCTPCSRSP
jgi:hypothetical protein